LLNAQNQTIEKFGKASLLFSKLPLSFYGEAQLHAVWLSNRLVQSGHDKSLFFLIASVFFFIILNLANYGGAN
jgi:hypothetical protein